MAEKLGISRASLSLYETCKQTPGLDVLDALYRLTGAPLEYLMGYTDNYTNETIGIDKEIGLSTEAIQLLKDNKVAQTAINRLIKSSLFLQWVDAATKYHDLSMTENRQDFVMIEMTKDATINSASKGQQYAKCFSIKQKMSDLYVKIGEIAADVFEAEEGEPYINQEPIEVNAEGVMDLLQSLIQRLPTGPDKERFRKELEKILDETEE